MIWIWMENTSYNDVIGSAQAPYVNALASECGLARDAGSRLLERMFDDRDSMFA